jgi:dihydrofolate reductase
MRVTLLAAQSLDGFITKHDQAGTDFTSEADKLHFRKALGGFDCSVMGGETYRVARDFLRTRLSTQRCRVVLTRSPEAYAAEAVPGQLEFSNVGAATLVKDLAARGFQHCALLGGAQLHGLFFQAGLVDELWITVEPLLFGQGTPLLAKRVDVRLSLLSSEKLSADTLLLKYRVQR